MQRVPIELPGPPSGSSKKITGSKGLQIEHGSVSRGRIFGERGLGASKKEKQNTEPTTKHTTEVHNTHKNENALLFFMYFWCES